VVKTGWLGGVANDLRKALSEGYHLTEEGLYKYARASGTAGYELGTFLRTGHFLPLAEAYKESGQIHENVPLIGNVSGRRFAKIGASLATQSLPIIGTFGHLASHPSENGFQKASDIAFGVADVLPFAGEIGSAIPVFKRPIEKGIGEVADILRRTLRISSPIRSGLFKTPLPTPTDRLGNFLKSVSKDVKFIAPIDKFPHISGVLNDVAKSVRNDLRVVGVAIDSDPVHILAHDTQGLLHDIGIARDGRVFHYVEDFGGGVKKVGESVITGGEDLFKSLKKEIFHILPFQNKITSFLQSGKLLGGLAGLGIGLSVAGGLTTPTTASTSTIATTQSSTTSGDTGPAQGAGGTCDPSCGGNPDLPPCPGCGSVLGQMNAGNVLESQLQQLSQSPENDQVPQNGTILSPSQPSPSSPTSSIFSNKLLLLGIVIIVIIIVIIVIMR